MAERNQNSYQLLRQFREFYVELARLRQMIELAPEQALSERTALSAGFAADAAMDEPSGTVALAVMPADTVIDDVWRAMARYLDQKMYEVNAAASSLSHDLMQELVYIMAAFADETFVCMLQWSGQGYWRDHLMELRLFHSQIAGQGIFQRIDRLLTRNDYGSEELTAVYLMVLSLGFRGRFQMEPEAVNTYRKRLFDRLHLSDSTFIRSGYRMFPEAYQHTVTEGSPVRLAEPGKWGGLVALLVAAWLVASTAAWLVLARPLNTDLRVTQRLLDAVRREFLKEDTATGTSYGFTKPNGIFQLALPADLPVIDKPDGRGVAPFFVKVETNGSVSAAGIQSWLAQGSSQIGAASSDGSQLTRPVLLAESVPAPQGVKVAPGTFYFLIDPDLTGVEIKSGAVLTLPTEAPAGVDALSLYIPEQSNEVAQ